MSRQATRNSTGDYKADGKICALAGDRTPSSPFGSNRNERNYMGYRCFYADVVHGLSKLCCTFGKSC